MGGDVENIHPPPIDLNHEQHVEAPQRNRVDDKEVRGQNALGLDTQELAPGRTRASRRGRETMAVKNGGDARLGDCDAKLLELTHDAEVAPARVLPCQAKDQVDGLLDQGRTARPPTGVSPVPTNEGSMPAKDRLGRDEEACPPLTRHEAGQGAYDRSIRPGEAGPADLPAEHDQLVAQHRDLCVLGHSIHPMETDHSDDTLDNAVEERECDGSELRRAHRAWSNPQWPSNCTLQVSLGHCGVCNWT